MRLAGLLVVIALALTGCAPGPSERTVELTVHHSRFSVDELQVRPGETVRFLLRNTGHWAFGMRGTIRVG